MLGPQWNGQGIVVLRKRAVDITIEELERLDPTVIGEIAAREHNLRQLFESQSARDRLAWLEAERAAAQELAGTSV